MNEPRIKFSSKLLLFGEYTIITGGTALAIPLERYSGKWVKNANANAIDLTTFFSYLKNIKGSKIKILEKAEKEHWWFDSTIPTGYGLGSSGALSAAAFSEFFDTEQDLDLLKDKLAEIESFFHGKSSGSDPLASYVNKAIHFSDDGIRTLNKLIIPNTLFLLDSKKPRKSKPLIEHFKIMLDADPVFQEATLALSKFNDRIITELISGQSMKASFREISLIQLEHFDKMIPAEIKRIWEDGLASDSFYVKLSGAGGGGYFIIYAEDKESLSGLETIR